MYFYIFIMLWTQTDSLFTGNKLFHCHLGTKTVKFTQKLVFPLSGFHVKCELFSSLTFFMSNVNNCIHKLNRLSHLQLILISIQLCVIITRAVIWVLKYTTCVYIFMHSVFCESNREEHLPLTKVKNKTTRLVSVSKNKL